MQQYYGYTGYKGSSEGGGSSEGSGEGGIRDMGGASGGGSAPPRIPDATSRKCTVSLSSDRLDLKIPFNRTYVIRLLLLLLVSRNHLGADRESYDDYSASVNVEEKELAASKPNRRMLAVLCRYRAGRFAIIPALIAILIGNVSLLEGCLGMISTESNQPVLQENSTVAMGMDSSKSHDLTLIIGMMSDPQAMLSIRRKMWLLVDYLLRKVSPLCWLGFMQDTQTIISMSIRNNDRIFASNPESNSNNTNNSNNSNSMGRSDVNSNLKSVLETQFVDPIAPALFRTPTMFHRVMLLLANTTGSWDNSSKNVLSRVVHRDMGYDYILHILEELLIPLSSYTIQDAEKAVQRQKLEIFANAISLSSNSDNSDSSNTGDGGDKDKLPIGDIGTAPTSSSTSTTSAANSGKRVRIIESYTPSAGETTNAVSGDSGRVVDSPFPMLCDETASAFATLIVSPNTAMTSALLKRITKGAKILSLSADNWKIVLDQLTPAACILADGVLRELVPLHRVLMSVVQKKGDVRDVLALPELCIPSESTLIPDIRLLQVVKLMMTMRGASAATPTGAGAVGSTSTTNSAAPSTSNTPSAPPTTGTTTGTGSSSTTTTTSSATPGTEVENIEDSAVIAKFIRKIDFKNLWDVLCTCLDAVRAVEGIIDPTMNVSESGNEVESNNNSNNNSNNSKGGSSSRIQHDPRKQKKDKSQSDQEEVPVLSSLTMRFMPLIETFFAVCGATMIRFPTATTITSESLGGTSGTGRKRLRDGDDISTEKDSNEVQSPSNDLSTAIPLQRVTSTGTSTSTGTGRLFGSPSGTHASSNSWLQQHDAHIHAPGERFRQHLGYLRMQCELVDVEEADNDSNISDNNDSKSTSRVPLSEQLLLLAEQNKLLINMILRQNISLLESSFSIVILVPRCRHLLHFDVKRTYFKMKLKKMKQDARLNNPNYSGGSVRVNVHRGSVFNDSFQKLAFISAAEMRKRLYVSFYEEEAIDAGGVTREWYSLLSREIFNPNYALFTATADGTTFQPNSYSHFNPEHLRYFKFVGRIIGKAMSDGHLLDAHFTRSFYKHILGIPVSFHDIEAVEPDYYKSLKQILEFPLELLSLELTFTAESNEFGEIKTVDLVKNGSNIAVDDDNKYEYVRLIAHHRMTSGISKQVC